VGGLKPSSLIEVYAYAQEMKGQGHSAKIGHKIPFSEISPELTDEF